MNIETCNKKCTTSALQLINSSPKIYNLIEDFLKNVKTIKDSTKFFTLYNYLIKKEIIKCDIGIYYIEKYLFESIYTFLFYQGNENKNIFINNKIILYQWIEPKHLEIEIIEQKDELYAIFEEINKLNELDLIAKAFAQIKTQKIANNKIILILNIIRNLYNFLGINANHDTLLSLLIYIIIKSQTKDVLLHLNFVNRFKRKRFKPCLTNCHHSMPYEYLDICSCYITSNAKDEEINYYLITLEAAIIFIERMEFKSLKINREEFDKNIKKYIANIQNESEMVIKKNKRIYDVAKEKINKLFK